MKQCSRCKKENPDDSRFCSSCGTPLDSQPTTNSQPLQHPAKKSDTLVIVAIAVIMCIGFITIILSRDQSKQGDTPPQARIDQTKVEPPAPDPLANLSKLHRSIIGHWVGYTQHMHAYISPDAIVLKREDGPRLESYKYKVYSEDGLLSTLLLKVTLAGDISEQTWEAQCLDYGNGVKLMIGKAQFSYVNSQTKP